jgi:hypothetical protein
MTDREMKLRAGFAARSETTTMPTGATMVSRPGCVATGATCESGRSSLIRTGRASCDKSHVWKGAVNGDTARVTNTRTQSFLNTNVELAHKVPCLKVFLLVRRMYPFIDAGGRVAGMIAGANEGLSLADNATKIVPGHGALGDKAALTRYRDMLVTSATVFRS